MEGPLPYRGKRAFDIGVCAVSALPVAVISMACAVAVKATSPGPVFFRQSRVGFGGREFSLLKFRTMTVEAADSVFPDAADITPAGRWLRRLSLDELPQLINVLRGEMSIVGPRPALRYQVERYSGRQRSRLLARPGITGLAQIRGRNRLTWSQRIDHDLDYISRQSPILDLKIILQTLAVVAGGGGVTGHPRDDPLAMPPE